MAQARLIIQFHPSDERWARRLRRLASLLPDVTLEASGSSGADDADGDNIAPVTIHVCSPAYASTARSPGSGEHVAFIVSGEPGARRFVGAEDEDCLPGALIGARRVEGRPDRRLPEDASREALSVALGVSVKQIAKAERRRRLGFAARVALVAGVGSVIVGAGLMLQNIRHNAEAAALTEAAVDRAVTALDQRHDRAAYAALATAFDGFPPGPRAEVALARAALETRLLADIASPSADIQSLSFLHGGVIAATGAEGGAWLIDPGAGEVTEINKPSAGVVARVSPDGDALWTARPGQPQADETGAAFVPLHFANIALAEAEVVSETVIRAPLGRLSEGVISPDGALFAADLGPGAGVETVIGVFRRGEQSLAGALRLPSDRARLAFVGPGHLLAVIDPPSGYGGSPGLYLWRVGAATPLELRRAGGAPVCPDEAAGVTERAIRAAQASGEIIAPQVMTSPNGREIALLLPRMGRGACLLRWRAPGGVVLTPIEVPGNANGAAILAEGGPYLIRRKARSSTLLQPGAPAKLLSACRSGDVIPLARPGTGAGFFLCPSGDDGVVASTTGAVWRRAMHKGGVTAAELGARDRLVTAGADGRIRLWDAAPRMAKGPVDVRNAKAFHGVASDGGSPRVAAVFANGLIRVLSLDGQATGLSIATGLDNVNTSLFGQDRLLVLGSQPDLRLMRVVNLTTGAVSEPHAVDPETRIKEGGLIIDQRGARRLIITSEGTEKTEPLFESRGGKTLDFDTKGETIAHLAIGESGGLSLALRRAAQSHTLRFAGTDGALKLSASGEFALLRIEKQAPPHDDEFYVIDVETGARTVVAQAPTVTSWFGFSASASAFAIRHIDATADIDIFSTRTGRKIGAAPGGKGAAVWSPVDDILLTGDQDVVSVTMANQSDTALKCQLKNLPARYLTFTPDGRRILTGARASGVAIVDADSCSTLRLMSDLRVVAPPFEAAENIVWVPTTTGPVVLPLGVDGGEALIAMRRRARALAAQ